MGSGGSVGVRRGHGLLRLHGQRQRMGPAHGADVDQRHRHAVADAHRAVADAVVRAVCRVHPKLYPWFNAVPLLRTHVLAWIEKPSHD